MGALDKINSLNLYAYCGNNPVMNVDPSGTWSWNNFWKGLAITFVVVAGIAAVIVSGGIAAGAIAGGLAIFANAVTTVTLGIACGGLVGGYMQESQGGSFWAGWIGGAINVGIQSALSLAGPLGTIIGGFLGPFWGTATMQSLDSKYTDGYYNSNSQIWKNALKAGAISAAFSILTAYTSVMVGKGNNGTIIGGDIYNRVLGSAITPAFRVLFPAFYSVIDDILAYLYS